MQRIEKEKHKARRLRAYRDGRLAETVATLLLRLKGYGIVARRYKTPVGEIDIVARKGAQLVFVEVKKRAEIGAALAVVSPACAARVRRAAQWWLAGQPALADKCNIRFDVVAVAPYAWPTHLSNVF